MLALADIFKSGMVLQREKPVVLWGTADPEARVEAAVGDNAGSAEAGIDGHWRVVLPPMEASGGLTVAVRSGGDLIELSDVAVGEVWIAGGQSNMEFWLRYEKHRAGEVEPHPDLRFYDVPKLSYSGQERDFDYSRVGVWRKALGGGRDYFSAVGYYFQKKIARELRVPVGIIGCNWGGTPSCAWMSRETARRAGMEWVEASREEFRGIDMADYLVRMANKPGNASGDPFHDPFNEFMLPRTPDQEEIDGFLANQPPVDPVTAAMPLAQNVPGAQYERMVRTIAPFSVRGVLWYQGESDDNGGRGRLYQDMLAALASDWRRLWEDPLPFLVVQLPGWESWFGFKNEGFPVIRECQRRACEADPDMHLCSISDAGERLDIHPKDKKVVGERLALLALGHVYGRDILCDPPYPIGVERDGRRIRIAFRNAGCGLEIRGGALSALDVTGSGGPMDFKADARGEILTVTLSGDAGSVHLSFAGTAFFRVNLYNSAGLPAIPFSIDV